MAGKSQWESQLAWQYQVARVLEPTREYAFHPKRKWRLDFAWPELMCAVEVEGVTHYGKNRDGSMKLGRHQTGKGITEDCEKYNEAALLGWTVLRVTQEHIRRGKALEWTESLLTQRGLNNGNRGTTA